MNIFTVHSLIINKYFWNFSKNLNNMLFMQKIFSNFWILLEFNLHRKWNCMKWRISATFCFALSPYKKPTEGPNRRNKGYHHCKVNSLGDQFTFRWSWPYFSECWMLLKNLYRSRWSKNITPWKLHPEHSWAILLCKSTLVNMIAPWAGGATSFQGFSLFRPRERRENPGNEVAGGTQSLEHAL